MNEKDQYTKVEVATFPPKDYLLSMLLLLCEHAGIGFPVTLAVNGLVVSGHMTPKKVFFTKLHAKMKSEAKFNATEKEQPLVTMVERVFKEFADTAEPGSPDKFGAALEKNDYPDVIHLENTTILSPDGGRLDVGLWRGRIDHISGFSIVSFG
jgi:hypothetical protein